MISFEWVAVRVCRLNDDQKKRFALKVVRWSFGILVERSSYDGLFQDDLEGAIASVEEDRTDALYEMNSLRERAVEGGGSYRSWIIDIIDLLMHLNTTEIMRWTINLEYLIHHMSENPEYEHIVHCFLAECEANG